MDGAARKGGAAKRTDAALAGTTLQLSGLAKAWLSSPSKPPLLRPGGSGSAARSSSCPPGPNHPPGSSSFAAAKSPTTHVKPGSRAVTFNLRTRRPGPAYSSPGEHSGPASSSKQPLIGKPSLDQGNNLLTPPQPSEASSTLWAATAGKQQWGAARPVMRDSQTPASASSSSPEPQPARYPGIVPSQPPAVAAQHPLMQSDQAAGSIQDVMAGSSPPHVITVEQLSSGSAAASSVAAASGSQVPRALDLLAAARVQMALQCSVSPAHTSGAVSPPAATFPSAGPAQLTLPAARTLEPRLPPAWSPAQGFASRLAASTHSQLPEHLFHSPHPLTLPVGSAHQPPWYDGLQQTAGQGHPHSKLSSSNPLVASQASAAAPASTAAHSNNWGAVQPGQGLPPQPALLHWTPSTATGPHPSIPSYQLHAASQAVQPMFSTSGNQPQGLAHPYASTYTSPPPSQAGGTQLFEDPCLASGAVSAMVRQAFFGQADASTGSPMLPGQYQASQDQIMMALRQQPPSRDCDAVRDQTPMAPQLPVHVHQPLSETCKPHSDLAGFRAAPQPANQVSALVAMPQPAQLVGWQQPEVEPSFACVHRILSSVALPGQSKAAASPAAINTRPTAGEEPPLWNVPPSPAATIGTPDKSYLASQSHVEPRRQTPLLSRRQRQLEALQRYAAEGLPLATAFAALGIDGTASSGSAADAEPVLEQLTVAALALPVRVLKLLAVRTLAAAASRSAVQSWHDAAARLTQVERETSLAAAYELALKLGFPKARLRCFRRLGVTGVTTVVLGPLQDKCRALLALRVMRAAVARQQDLEAMIDHAAWLIAPALTGALFGAWRSEARWRAQGRARVAWLQEVRAKGTQRQHLAAWRKVAHWRAEARRRLDDARAQLAGRNAAHVLTAWRLATEHAQWRRAALAKAVAQRMRLLLASWHGAAAAKARRALCKARANAQYLRGLLTCAIAQWRLLQLQAHVRRRWKQAITGWHNLRLKGQVLRQWHAQASRAAAILARAAAQRYGAGSAKVHVPLPLSGGGPAAAQLLSATTAAVLPVLDEMHHLRRYCRLYVRPDEDGNGPEGRLPCDDATWQEFQQVAEAEGSRLLLGHWQYKEQVLHLVSHKLALQAQKSFDEAALAQATLEQEAKAVELAGQQEQLRHQCCALQAELAELQEAGRKLEAQEAGLTTELEAVSQQLQQGGSQQQSLGRDAESAGAQLAAAEQQEGQARRAAGAAAARSQAAAQAAQDAAQQLAQAERTGALALADDHRARERLLAEQQRLAETMDLCSALSQHLWQLQAAPAPANPQAQAAAQQSVAAAAANLQEAHAVLELVQVETQHQAAAAAALATASSEAQRALVAAHQRASSLAAEAEASTQASQAAWAAHLAAKEQLEAAAVKAAAVWEEAGRSAARSESVRGREAAVTAVLGSTQQQLSGVVARLVAIKAALADADTESQRVRLEAEASEAGLRQKQLELQPGVMRAQVLLLQLANELERYPSELVRVLEAQQQQQKREQQLQDKLHQGKPAPLQVPWASSPLQPAAGRTIPWQLRGNHLSASSPTAALLIGRLQGGANARADTVDNVMPSPDPRLGQGKQVLSLSQLLATEPVSPARSDSIMAQPGSVDRIVSCMSTPSHRRSEAAMGGRRAALGRDDGTGRREALDRVLRGWLSTEAQQGELSRPDPGFRPAVRPTSAQPWVSRAQGRARSPSPRAAPEAGPGGTLAERSPEMIGLSRSSSPPQPQRQAARDSMEEERADERHRLQAWDGVKGALGGMQNGSGFEAWAGNTGRVSQPPPGVEPWVPPGPPDPGLGGSGASHHRNASPPRARNLAGWPLPLSPCQVAPGWAAVSLQPIDVHRSRSRSRSRSPPPTGALALGGAQRSNQRQRQSSLGTSHRPALTQPIARRQPVVSDADGAAWGGQRGLTQALPRGRNSAGGAHPGGGNAGGTDTACMTALSDGGGGVDRTGKRRAEAAASPSSSITFSLCDLASLTRIKKQGLAADAGKLQQPSPVKDTLTVPSGRHRTYPGLPAVQPVQRMQLHPNQAVTHRDRVAVVPAAGHCSSSSSSADNPQSWPLAGHVTSQTQQPQQRLQQQPPVARGGYKAAAAPAGFPDVSYAGRLTSGGPLQQHPHVAGHLNCEAPTAVAAILRGMQHQGGAQQVVAGRCGPHASAGSGSHKCGPTSLNPAVGAMVEVRKVGVASTQGSSEEDEEVGRGHGLARLDAEVGRQYTQRLAERVLMRLAAGVLESSARQQVAQAHGDSRCLHRFLRHWRSNVQWAVSWARGFAAASLLKRCLVGWHHRTLAKLSQWHMLQQAWHAADRRIKRRVLRVWRQWAARKVYQHDCVNSGRRWRLHRDWGYWRGLVQAKALLHRVFLTAAQLWEFYCVTPVYGEEYQLLSTAMQRWRQLALEKREKHQARAAEQAADAHRSTRLVVAAFGALSRAVWHAWELRRAHRTARLLLQRWLQRAEAKRQAGKGLGVLRRRLWARGLSSEAQAYRQHLLGRVFWAWAAPLLTASDHAHHSQARRAWLGWQQFVQGEVAAAGLLAFVAETPRRRTTQVLRCWRAAVAARKAKVDHWGMAEHWRQRQMQRTAMKALKQRLQRRRALLDAIQASFVHRRHSLLRKALCALRPTTLQLQQTVIPAQRQRLQHPPAKQPAAMGLTPAVQDRTRMARPGAMPAIAGSNARLSALAAPASGLRRTGGGAAGSNPAGSINARNSKSRLSVSCHTSVKPSGFATGRQAQNATQTQLRQTAMATAPVVGPAPCGSSSAVCSRVLRSAMDTGPTATPCLQTHAADCDSHSQDQDASVVVSLADLCASAAATHPMAGQLSTSRDNVAAAGKVGTRQGRRVTGSDASVNQCLMPVYAQAVGAEALSLNAHALDADAGWQRTGLADVAGQALVRTAWPGFPAQDDMGHSSSAADHDDDTGGRLAEQLHRLRLSQRILRHWSEAA